MAGVHGGVRISDPAHLPLACAVIGCRDVNSRADEILLDQLNCIPPGDIFKFPNGIVFRINSDAAFGAAERNVDDGTFIGHQCGKCHHFILVNHVAITDTAFGGRHVLGMFNPPGVDDLEVISAPERETESVNAVAYFDLVQ